MPDAAAGAGHRCRAQRQLAARGQRAAVARRLARRGAEVAALARDARLRAGPALEREFGDLDPVAASVARSRPSRRSSPSTSARSASLSAPRVPFQRGSLRLPDERGIGVQRAGHAPARRRQHRPDAQVRHPRRDAAGQRRIVGPLPAALALLHPRAGLDPDLARPLAVPGQVGAHGVAFGVERELGALQPGRRAGPGAGGIHGAFAGGARAVAADARDQRGLAGLHPQVAAFAHQAGLGAQGVAGVDVPVAVEQQVAAEADLRQRLAVAEQLGPGHRQALQPALGLQPEGPPRLGAGAAEAQRLPSILTVPGAGPLRVAAAAEASRSSRGLAPVAVRTFTLTGLPSSSTQGATSGRALSRACTRRLASAALHWSRRSMPALARVSSVILRLPGLGFALQGQRGLGEAAGQLGTHAVQHDRTRRRRSRGAAVSARAGEWPAWPAAWVRRRRAARVR